MKTYSFHVYIDSGFTVYTSMRQQALISSKLYVQLGAALSVS
jgi:hypothetical protein